MMVEEWREFNGYQVSNYGRVILKSGRVTTGWERNGYKAVSFSSGKYYIHRIVAELFCEGWFEGAQVDHIDRDPTNNRADNLRWVSQSDNIRNQGNRAKVTKVSDNVVVAMTILKNEYGFNNTELARVFGLDRRYISKLFLGRYRTDLTGL